MGHGPPWATILVCRLSLRVRPKSCRGADGREAPKRRVGQRRQLHQRVIYLTQTCDDHGVIEFRQRGIPSPRERSFASLDRGSTPKPVDLKTGA